jgi:lipopolysaccharide export system permease protein
MKILDRYIAVAVASGAAIALLLIVGLESFFVLIKELDSVGEGGYTIGKMLQYVLLGLPRSLYELFPAAALIGGLIGMGALAVNSELVAMRAGGLSIWRIVMSVLQTGVLMLVVIVALGETVAPVAEEYAQRLRAVALDKHVSFLGRDGIWVREEERYIFIERIIDDRQLANLRVFEFDDARRLVRATRAGTATHRDDGWELQDVEQSQFGESTVSTRREASMSWPSLITPSLLDIVVLKPENMSVLNIRRFIEYLEDNGLDPMQYRYAFWGRFVVPLSALLSLFIAVPLVFGSLRSTGTGQRVFVGILLGFGFYLINRMAGQMGQVYELNPLLASFAPGVIVLFAGFLMVRRL